MTANSIPKHIPSYSLTEVSNKPGTMFEAKEVCISTIRNMEQMFVPHRKDYYFFFLVKKGDSHHWVDFLRYQVHPHNLYFTLPHQVHLKEKATPTEGLLIAFTEEFLTLCNDDALKQLPILQNKAAKHAITLSVEEEAFFDGLFRQILAEAETDQAFKTDALQAYVKLFLVRLSRIYTQQFATNENIDKGNTVFTKLTQLLDKNIYSWHQPADYADALNITVGHLNAVVKVQLGKTITELVQERFILEAKRALFHTSLSVKEVAYRLGFEDAAYFNRIFKKLAGITPLEFRKQNREKYH